MVSVGSFFLLSPFLSLCPHSVFLTICLIHMIITCLVPKYMNSNVFFPQEFCSFFIYNGLIVCHCMSAKSLQLCPCLTPGLPRPPLGDLISYIS